ncbi:MAG: hypothetical protein V1739_07705 [Candidatus Omnitrophota bacterium]
MSDWLVNLGVSVGIVTGGLWLLENYDKYEKIKAMCFKPFIGVHKNIQKIFLSNNLQGRINSFAKNTARDIGEKNQCKVQIKWVEKENLDAFFKDDKLIIKMDCAGNMYKNLSVATLIYIAETLVRQARPYIKQKLNNAIDLMVAKTMFEEEAEEQEIDYFNNVILFPQTANDIELQTYCKGIEFLQDKGYFSRLFLREMKFLGKTVGGTIPTEEIKQEIDEFLSYVIKLAHTPIADAKGEFLEPADFEFVHRYLKIRVVLFANVGNINTNNIRPYLKRIKKGIKEGAEIFYLLGKENSIPFIRLLQKDIDRRLVKQRILKKTDDRVFVMKRTDKTKEKHHSVIYRKLQAVQDIDLDSIFEDVDAKTRESYTQTEE